jgi:hypothetical protein
MTENGLVIQTISTKRTDKQADRVLQCIQVTFENKKSQPFAFFKISFSQPHKRHICKPHKPTRKPKLAKEPFFPSHNENFS